MPKHIVFVVHGVGVHGDGWAEASDGPVTTLRQIAESGAYAYFNERPLESRVDFRTIVYDKVFTAILKKWQNDATNLPAADRPEIRQALVSWLGEAGETESNFWWTHAADVVLYRFFPTYRQDIRAEVLGQMAKALEEAVPEGARPPACSVLAHSMGTAVAHDCMHLLGTVRWGDHANALSPAHWRFENVFMVANVSRLLQTKDAEMKPVYESIVRPGPVEDPGSYCGRYFNFRHELDPIPYPRMFEPVGWKGYTSEIVRHYREYNIHGFSHYLLNPRVHIPILRATAHRNAVTEPEAIKAVNPDNFPQFGGKLKNEAAVQEFIAEVDRIRSGLGDDPDFQAWLTSLCRFYSAIQTLRTRLGGDD